MRARPRFVSGFIVTVMVGACGPDDSNVVRGKGLTVAPLSVVDQARVYEAAIHGAFEVDPSLSLLLDSRELPRGIGLSPEGAVPDSVAAELRQRGVTRGVCQPPLATKGVPHCTAALPGYIVRFSPVFAMRGDSVQVYVFVQKYDTPNSEPSQTLRFERAYQVVRSGGEWRAVREGRVPKETRGERTG
jgi:hypothetical protein